MDSIERVHQQPWRLCRWTVGWVLLAAGWRTSSAQVATVTTTSMTSAFSSLWTAPAAADAGVTASLTVLVVSGGVQSIPSLRDNAINAFPSPVRITTSWSLSSLLTSVDLVAYFTSPSSALVNGSATIPSSRMEGRMSSGRVKAFTPFADNPVRGVGAPGGSLHLFRQFILWPFNHIGQRTDDLDLQLNLIGFPALTSGTYVGTLNLRAVSY